MATLLVAYLCKRQLCDRNMIQLKLGCGTADEHNPIFTVVFAVFGF